MIFTNYTYLSERMETIALLKLRITFLGSITISLQSDKHFMCGGIWARFIGALAPLIPKQPQIVSSSTPCVV